jgi:hypothetical protein
LLQYQLLSKTGDHVHNSSQLYNQEQFHNDDDISDHLLGTKRLHNLDVQPTVLSEVFHEVLSTPSMAFRNSLSAFRPLEDCDLNSATDFAMEPFSTSRNTAENSATFDFDMTYYSAGVDIQPSAMVQNHLSTTLGVSNSLSKPIRNQYRRLESHNSVMEPLSRPCGTPDLTFSSHYDDTGPYSPTQQLEISASYSVPPSSGARLASIFDASVPYSGPVKDCVTNISIDGDNIVWVNFLYSKNKELRVYRMRCDIDKVPSEFVIPHVKSVDTAVYPLFEHW